MERQQIISLPLNGRLFSQLVALTPGAVQRGFGDFGEDPAAAGAGAPVNVTVNGLPWSGNNYLIDGVGNNEPLNQFINIRPPLEAIQEFKVQTNNPTAEYGVFGGALINLTMRSGANQIHGTAFEYLRNDALNARSFFAPEKAGPSNTANNLRTPPLWGLHIRSRYMHDLASLTLQDAIERHRHEAGHVADEFKQLTTAPQRLLITFLKSL